MSNRLRFVQNSIKKFGKRFSFPDLEKNYETQKNSKVTIGCPDHPEAKMTPDKHLQSKTGCPDCGIEERARKKLEKGRKTFLEKFKNKFSDNLKIKSEYDGSKSNIDIECKQEGHIFPMYVGNIDWAYDNGCPICYRPILSKSMMMSEDDFIDRCEKKFPELDFSITKYRGSFEPIEFICHKHGEQEVANASDFLHRSFLGCPTCSDEHKGYSGYRIRLLKSGDPTIKSRPTTIAIMKMKIWGFDTYKLGITHRKLEVRYRGYLKIVYFEARLDEIDALMLEHLLLVKYKNDKDTRIKDMGIRNGERWSGDTELFLKRTLKPMLSELKSLIQEISEKDPNYWARFKGLKLPFDKTREVEFNGGEWNMPRKIICLDDKTVFSSLTEAARLNNSSIGNISLVCTGNRKHAKNKRFAYLDDYENGNIPHFIPSSGNKRKVRCIETGEIFSSIVDADKEKSAKKITDVCKGNRNTSGGFHWEYI